METVATAVCAIMLVALLYLSKTLRKGLGQVDRIDHHSMDKEN